MKKIMFEQRRSEKQIRRNTYQFVNIRPGGNDTGLVQEIIADPLKRKEINNEMMQMFPNIEQVGFVNLNIEELELMMAGGEFCGNATRSTAYLALNGQPGEVAIKVSGVKDKLRAGVAQNGEAYAQMPIYQDANRVSQDLENPRNSIVYMEGITQYVNWDTSSIEGKNPDEIKKQAMELMREKGLDTSPAAGVMYVKETPQGLEIVPVVYVRDINTLFYETACGSGTTAVGLTLAKQSGSSIKDVTIYQPSGLPIKVSVDYDGNEFGYAQIQGPVEIQGTGTLTETEKGAYVIEQIFSPESLKKFLEEGNLVELYKRLFSKEPYFEQFSDEEVVGYFNDYVRNGLLFLAQDGKKTVGFGAAVPLSKEIALADLGKQFGIDPESTWYMADLGVDDEKFQRVGMAKQLVEARLNAMPKGTTALMRTSVDNIASLSLYHGLGFTEISGMIQEVEKERTDNEVKKDKRIFLSKII
ncbi:hypothetical protein COW57_00450 [Candidatus Roizmanbacteria bacterium CG17_big_fil_post_rev_8_21_14_2_50_39_7]|uniref:N-acetyltransferase domain-containing protein n=2 Tax=Candidatus Roizmaniibacteriota TaxID=1752723 RepID=A0A2M7EL30_9BACT|nr:MAG: hypothetical protein COS52_01965 [Candidatus Roizmanbacteria bacterium CG03_land_8_20_14_0_80_39_12]PIV71266.1 MAG: hypothetical protein COW57_00450 [Candidatus Roizmanbacteria bacterium CG17_big_fil_post_rev_8_21_14_2_50_39_7]